MNKKIFVLLFGSLIVAGYLGGASFKNQVTTTPISPSTILDLAQKNYELRNDNQSLVKQIQEQSQQGNLANDLKTHSINAGLVKVTGPGVEIVLSTNDRAEEQNPETLNLLANHILKLVNTLWNGGAEAISINGERFTAFTEVENVSNYVQINSQIEYPPFIIDAIGDPSILMGALKFYKWNIIDSIALYGITETDSIKQNIQIKGAQEKDFKYAQPINGQ